MTANKPLYVTKTKLQISSVDSFVGGHPKLPANTELPHCMLCKSLLSFYFQFALPVEHGWNGQSLAFFACTSCVDQNYFIPEMLDGPLLGARIPDGFLKSYQKNFRIMVFDTNEGVVRKDYEPRVEFREIKTGEVAGGTLFGSVGKPKWFLDDESPGLYRGQVMRFLMQVAIDTEFSLVENAPLPVPSNMLGLPNPTPLPYYRLFIGNETYFFGTEDKPYEVYALPQS